jgi:hypothetical protein
MGAYKQSKLLDLNIWGTERTFICIGSIEIEFEHYSSLVSISNLDSVSIWISYASEELQDEHVDALKAYMLTLNLLKHGQSLEVLYV